MINFQLARYTHDNRKNLIWNKDQVKFQFLTNISLANENNRRQNIYCQKLKLIFLYIRALFAILLKNIGQVKNCNFLDPLLNLLTIFLIVLSLQILKKVIYDRKFLILSDYESSYSPSQTLTRQQESVWDPSNAL